MCILVEVKTKKACSAGRKTQLDIVQIVSEKRSQSATFFLRWVRFYGQQDTFIKSNECVHLKETERLIKGSFEYSSTNLRDVLCWWDSFSFFFLGGDGEPSNLRYELDLKIHLHYIFIAIASSILTCLEEVWSHQCSYTKIRILHSQYSETSVMLNQYTHLSQQICLHKHLIEQPRQPIEIYFNA